MQSWIWIILLFGSIVALSVLYVIVKRGDIREKVEQRALSDWATWGSGLLGLSVTLLDWIVLKEQTFNRAYLFIGCALFGSGLIIRITARLALGRYYSPRVCILKNHRLITSGIYGIIRHPGYLGFFLEALGISLVFNSIWGLLCMVAGFLPALLYRIIREEELLREHFGATYEEYSARTRKLIPFLF